MPFTRENARALALLGGGRPKGLSIDTKRKIAKKKAYDRRVLAMTDKLLNSQSIVALGTYKMLRPYIGEDGKMHVEQIRDDEAMQKLIDTGEFGKDYLIVAGTLPDWRASDAILNRTYGKPKETIELGAETVFSLKALAIERERERGILFAEAIDITPKIDAPVKNDDVSVD